MPALERENIARLGVDILDRLGRTEDTQAVRWSIFATSLSSDILAEYLGRLPEASMAEARQRAVAVARGHRDVHRAMQLLADLAPDMAAELGLQPSGIAFTGADMPNANRLTVGIMAMVAEEERRAISERTKAALAAAKARGVKLGGRVENLKNAELGRQKAAEARQTKAASRTADLLPVVDAIRADGITSATGIAKALNERGIPTSRSGRWQAVQVQRLLRGPADRHRAPESIGTRALLRPACSELDQG